MINVNSAIVSVIDIATLTAVIDVVERDYFKIRTGMLAEIETAAIPGRIFPARVSRIAPLLNEMSRQARIELELGNADHMLKPGMFIKARLIYERHDEVTIAPASALVRRNDLEGVFVADLEKNLANFVPIQVGFREGAKIEVASPTISGNVVVLGHHLLEDGSQIRLPGKAEAPKKGPAAQKGNGQGKGGQQR